ncbi:MAG: glycosyltransferase family 1 protein [Gemmatimonadales bacterium]|nr:glycosyltransferase family 1 protein [Gemmatimonadales bacterium]
MRALYFSDTYPPQVNGVSVVTELSVAGLLDRGWDVGLVTPRYPGGPGVFGRAAGQSLLELPARPCPGYPEIQLAAPRFVKALGAARRFRPDLIHCATEFSTGWVGQWVARRLGVPVVTSYHTDFGRYMEAYGVPWLRSPVTRFLTGFHRRARRTLTPSRVTRTELVERGIERAMVWGCGVDAVRFAPGRRSEERRRALGVDGRFLFLHVGRLAPEKGVDRILAAFGRCRAVLGDRVQLIIAGDGPAREELARLAPPGVTLLGYLDRHVDLPELYASADAFLFASETETLGLVILEAMASGLPVVAAPAGGVADHLEHGVNGLAFAPGDGEAMTRFMIELVEHPPFRNALADGARRTAERLSWDRELDRLDRCYREVLAEGAGAVAATAELPERSDRSMIPAAPTPPA